MAKGRRNYHPKVTGDQLRFAMLQVGRVNATILCFPFYLSWRTA